MQCEFTGGASILTKKSDKDKKNPELIKEVVKIGGFIEADILEKLLVCSPTEISNWWFHDDDGLPRFQQVEDFKLSNVYIEHYLIVDDVEFTGCTLEKFSFTLKRNRRAYIEFTASIIADEIQKSMLDEYFRHGFPALEIREMQKDLVEEIAA